MELDVAAAELLGVDPKSTSVTQSGNGCSSAFTAQITARLADGSSKRYFMKTAPNAEGQVMIQGTTVVTMGPNSTGLQYQCFFFSWCCVV